MAPATLQMIVMAAEDLKNVATFGKMDLYAVAWVDPYLRCATRVLRKAGRNPVWNDTISLSLESTRHYSNALLTIQIFSESSLGDKVVGTARLPLQEVLRISPRDENLDPVLVTLQMQRPSGRVQGIVSFSMRVTGESLPLVMQPSQPGFKYGEDLVMGIPVPPFSGDTSAVGRSSSGYPTSTSSGSRDVGVSESIPYAYPPPHTFQGHPGYYSGDYPRNNPGNYQGNAGTYPTGPFSYLQPPQQQNRSNSGLLMGLLGGVLGGLILGDILT